MSTAVFNALRAEIERLEAAHPDQAIMLIESPSGVAVSSVNRAPQVRKHLLQSITLKSDGIWFNTVPGTRDRNSGLWNSSTMSVGVSPVKRTELLLPVPARVQITDGDHVTGAPPLVAALADWLQGKTPDVRKAEIEYRLQQFGYIFPDADGNLQLTPPGQQELKLWGLA
ncbi:hypothetical protein [Burkholderia arboris]|uniref:hypothetical protein n=1 Tax=Burkholderia arboris TaxID=488730 RepID=UPI0030F02757